MRVALTQKKTSVGGQTLRVWELALALRERGHEVFIISPPGGYFAERAKEHGFPTLELRMKGLPTPVALFRMARFLRKNRIDVLHCHDPQEHQISCFAARLAGVKAVIRTKCNNLPLRNWMSRWIHGPLTSHLLSVSDDVKRVLVEGGIDPDHVTTIHNFMDCEKFRPTPPSAELKASLALPLDVPVVGTVGRLHESKGIADLIRAVPAVVAEAPRARFLFVGGRHEQWQPLVEELSVEPYCTFTGSVANDAVPDYLNLMDVIVFPTYKEGFSRAVLEAMATRRAIVATRVGGVPEAIEHERSGLLVDPHRPDQLAEAILRMLGDAGLRKRLAEAAYRDATEKFTREKYLEKIERTYRTALGD